MTAWPDSIPVLIEMAWGADPDGDPGEWEFVPIPAKRVLSESITISRGRSDEAGQSDPTGFSFVLDNNSGDYTPGQALSPLYPYVRLGVPCRLSVVGLPAELGGPEPLVRATGFVAEWVPDWPAGDLSTDDDPGHAVVTVRVAGITRRLGLTRTVEHSALRRHFTSHPEVIAYWPCEDGSEARSVASPIAGVAAFSPSGDVGLGGTDGPSGSAQVLRASSGASNVRGRVPRHPDTDRYVYQHCFRQDEPNEEGSPRTMLTLIQTGAAARSWRVRASDTDFLVEVRNSDEDVVISPSQAVSPLLLGRWLRVVLELTQVGSALQWRATAMSAGPDATIYNQLSGSMSNTTLRRVTHCGLSFGVLGPPDRHVGHMVLLRDSANSLTDDHSAWHGYTGERAAERFERLCSEEGVRCTVIGDPARSMRMGPQRTGSVIAAMEDCADTDLGILAETRDGFSLLMRIRDDMVNQQASLELDAGTWPGDIVPPFAPPLDDQRTRNEITVSRPGGSSVTVADTEHRREHGQYPQSANVNVLSEPLMSQIGGWLLHLGTWPGMRYPTLSPALEQVPGLIPEWAAVELGDRVTVTNLPPQHPVDAVDLLIQGYSETLTPHSWTAQANASPGGPWTVWELEHEDRGRLYPTSSVLAAGVDAEDTTLTVETTGPPWINSTDHAGQLPLRIVVAGEVMQVTAITQPVGTGPAEQTFTVVRGLNGITKPHAAGAVVDLWPGHVIAL